ncbi:MAG: transposase [Candidatus Marinimicrobia bacterium]|nr:transposase [Candidatus Neomarinimicrobiota bacterium]
MSFSIAYHVMLRAEDHGKEIDLKNDKLTQHISNLLKKNDCHIYALCGRYKQVHMLFSLNPKIALANLIENIMSSTESLIKNEFLLEGFQNWEKNYWAYTHGTHFMDHIIDFIRADDEEYQEERRAREEYLYYCSRKGRDIDDDPFFDELYFMDV